MKRQEIDEEMLKALQEGLDGYPGVNYDDLLKYAKSMMDEYEMGRDSALAETIDFYYDEVAELEEEEY